MATFVRLGRTGGAVIIDLDLDEVAYVKCEMQAGHPGSYRRISVRFRGGDEVEIPSDQMDDFMQEWDKYRSAR